MSLFPEDKRAAMVGAVVTAVLLVAMAFTIVELTSAAKSEHEAAPAAGATH